MSERHFKTTGIVLRKTDLNEADRILTILSPDLGKIHCLAKGSRRLKSRFCGRVELFHQLEVTGFQGRELGHLDEIEVQGGAALFDLELLGHASLFYIAEITNRLLPDGQRAEGVFELLSETLRHLAAGDDETVMLQAYLVKLLTNLGFMAFFDRCSRTGEKLDLSQPVFFHAEDASAVSALAASAGDLPLLPPIVKWIHFLQRYGFADIRRVRPSADECRQVKQLTDAVIFHVLSGPLKSEAFLTSVGSA